ncbi:hypothetical protein Tco_0938614 [Tanacetum coccineum]|uniref:Uncharacterized protein n=1 Tax=Tanacetum coccineum TaxID=301880 RepID=A0ABQ5DIC1_9ASTR
MTTLAEFMIIAGADNRPPMLEKSLYDFLKTRMEFYMKHKDNGIMILDSVQNGPLVWPTVVQEDSLPPDVYCIVNHHKVAKEIWDRVKLLIPVQVNTKFLNSLLPEWSKFVTDVKLARNLHTTNYDQLYSYLEQHEIHANETRFMRERYQDPLAFFPQIDSGLVVLVFNQGDDPIACLNKAMAFLTTVASSRVTVQQVQGRQGQSYAGNSYKGNATSSGGNNVGGQARVVKFYNYQGEGHMASQCTQPKRPMNVAWFKENAMLAEAQEAGQILDEEQLAFLADLGIPDGQAAQTIISSTAAFQTEDLDAYDSDCDDVFNAKAVLMAPYFEPYHTDMDNRSVHVIQGFEQTPVADFTNNKITSDSNIIPYSQYLQEMQQAAVQDTNLYAQQDSMILFMIEQMSKQMINHVKNRKRLIGKRIINP